MSGNIRFIILSLFLLPGQTLCAQKEASKWFFGFQAGLDFISGSPVVINGSPINTMEGSAVISNSAGELKFYTDGMTVWNRFHQEMPNGTGLHGHTSSTQSAHIVPVIGDTNRYYVFTIGDYSGAQELQYSIVDMHLDSGRGDVSSKNIPVMTGVSEKLTAVRHCNQRDLWVITHSTIGNTYYAYLVDQSGVHAKPVISITGSSCLGFSQGQLKASPDGKKLAFANFYINADVSDFDNITGQVSNSYSLLPISKDSTYRPYGIEFSPNGKLLYATSFYQIKKFYLTIVYYDMGNFLIQYDVSLPDTTAVKASQQIIANTPGQFNFQGLQSAIDGKIYMAKNYKNLDVIRHPNVYGAGCVYVADAIQLPISMSTRLGLPNFTQSYFFQRDSFSYSLDCPGNKVSFKAAALSSNETYSWNFGDTFSGADNTSALLNPVHNYTSAGYHNVQLITHTPCGSDTLKRIIKTYPLQLDLGADTLLCGNATLKLNAPDGYQYLWQDGTTDSSFTVATPGTFKLQIRNALGCTTTDSIKVKYDQKPVFSLGPDQMICPGETLHLQPVTDPAWSLHWQDGSTADNCTVKNSGIYTLQALNNCGMEQDMVLVYPGICKVNVPSGFTPNGDGKNDLFKILGSEHVTSLALKIFNRWGEVVFETNDKTRGWDGKFRGKDTPAGTYVYFLEYRETNANSLQQLKGSFVLIR
jgi:gliding motility-associated-like protein